MFQDLARLFGNPRRVKLLKFFVFQPDARVSASEAGRMIGMAKTVAEREAAALARSGILVAKRQPRRKVGAPTEASGRSATFSLNRAHPWLPSLSAFLDATTLPSDKALLGEFRGIRGVSLIVATGWLAKEDRSQIDLLIVARKSKGKGKEKELEQAVRRAESMAGMPLRYAILDPKRYTERLEARDRLLRDVFEFSHRVIFGRVSAEGYSQRP